MASTNLLAQRSQPSYHSFVDFHPDEIDEIGFIVPQMLYVHPLPNSISERQWNSNRPPPIDFKVNGRLGISLADALQLVIQDRKDLQLAPAPIEYYETFLPIDPRYKIRIQWPGYKPYKMYSANVMPYDVRFESDMRHLAVHVARVMCRFFDSPSEHVGGSSSRWNGWDGLEKFKNNPDKSQR
ncbi:hypothetical protein BDY19DRAFT_587375 [Irpex rosettiformis]|uniref:Uncharacterized protein n=1 Tax=Irpex rosettiformis TaxID=378272 RepID=A0ACB8UD35_9APHY|nr:hypothetical protein BDY19DRAFT_587375 [Irpex rosettiformis]